MTLYKEIACNEHKFVPGPPCIMFNPIEYQLNTNNSTNSKTNRVGCPFKWVDLWKIDNKSFEIAKQIVFLFDK